MRDFFRLLKGWTNEVSIFEEGQQRRARAFIQPVSVTDPEDMGTPTPAGTVDGRRYLLIAEPGAIAKGRDGITVELNGKLFQVLRCELMGGGSHWEGIMKRKAVDGDAG